MGSKIRLPIAVNLNSSVKLHARKWEMEIDPFPIPISTLQWEMGNGSISHFPFAKVEMGNGNRSISHFPFAEIEMGNEK